MNKQSITMCSVSKTAYAPPQINIILISCQDIIVTSGGGDKDRGEWDPQMLGFL